DFNIGAKIIAWTKIEKELEKCVLLCANCHAEEHYNQEEIEEQEKILSEFETKCREKTNCIICGKETYNKRFCSQTCCGLNPKIKWPSDNELQKMLNEMPVLYVAEKLNVSDSAIHKRIKKCGLTKPPHGHFFKKENKIKFTYKQKTEPNLL